MTLRRSHGKKRTELPRSAELAPVDPDAKRADERAAGGRFAAGNQLGNGARWKHLLADSLGRDLAGEAGQLGREAHRMYRAFLRDLPADTASVRALVVDRARWTVLAARYARRAAELGLDTPEGMKALERSERASQRAERLAVTSHDLATTASARRPPIDAHATVVATFAAPVPRRPGRGAATHPATPPDAGEE